MKITNSHRQHIATALVLCIIAVAIYSFSQTTLIAKAQSSVNAYDDCPPNATANNMIWVHIDSQYSPTGQEIYKRIPFDTGTVIYEENINGSSVWVEYDNYIRGVLVGELADAEPLSGSNKWDPEMIKAMAIAIRTKAYHRCGWWARPDGTRYIQGQVTQEYRYDPTMRDVSDRTHQSYQNAANNTSDIYLGYQASTFDIEFRDRTGIQTFDNVLPHKGVYDPVGHPWGGRVGSI